MISASVIINTVDRAAFLLKTLQSCQLLRYPMLEIVVVNGPSCDNTAEVVARFPDVRFVECPSRNLAQSRNIGIHASRGDILFFIDDDAVCEPNWVSELIRAFDEPDVGAAHGFVRDQSGLCYQYLFGTVDAFGRDRHAKTLPVEYATPAADRIPSVIGVNCAFRREAMIAVRGFDEEFEFFLDETEVCARILRAGYRVVARPFAEVHHSWAPSHLRATPSVPKSLYQFAKSSAYFTALINLDGANLLTILHRCRDIRRHYLKMSDALLRRSLVSADVHARFLDEVERGIRDGVASAFRWPNGHLPAAPAPASPLPVAVRPQRPRVIIVSQDYPPLPLGGVGVILQTLAKGLAARGVEVSVVTRSPTREANVTFEAGVWVHRIASVRRPIPAGVDFPPLPGPIAQHASAVAFEVARIKAQRGADVVLSSIWDAEAIYCTGLPDLLHTTLLVTTYGLVLPSKPEWEADAAFMSAHVQPMLAAEAWLLKRFDAVFASTKAVLSDIEATSRIDLRASVKLVQFGLDDVALPTDLPAHANVRLLFVGRLERRKGIDLLVKALASVMVRHEQLDVRIVGDNSLPFDGKPNFQAWAQERFGHEAWWQRITFVGRVDDGQLLAEYAACDIFVAPSRYESFGLIYLEAMRFGKPCIGTRTGGIPEVVEDGVTGLLVPPDDDMELARAIDLLAGDPDRRSELGRVGRGRYAGRFTTEAYIDRMLRALEDLVSP